MRLTRVRGGPLAGEALRLAICRMTPTTANSFTIDWTQKEAVRANMRRKVKRLLRKHGYPPDKREEAVVTVIEQAEAVCRDWADAA